MRFGSVCSGIEAASVAWEPLNWQAAWFSEIEPFPSAVLAHHYPDTPNLGDMTTLPDRIRNGEVEAPDLFCGGTPCQAFSVAGLRKSLGDARGNLSLTFCEIADAIDESRSVCGLPAAIVFWENVPGVLSTRDNAFGCFLAQLCGGDEPLHAPDGWPDAGCVSGPRRTAAWRVLDAQYFGVAQRRKRVFVVASARDGFDPAAVLFEWQGLRRDSAPSREAGQRVANVLTDRADQSGTNSEGQRLIPQIVGAITAKGPGAMGAPEVDGQHYLPVVGFDAYNNTATGDIAKTLDVGQDHHHVPLAFHPTQTPISSENVCHAIGANENATAAVAVNISDGLPQLGSVTGTLDCWSGSGRGSSQQQAVMQSMQVRRLTPVECERLQGFPDGYSAIPWRGKSASDCPDGPRYKALGNSWAVPVVRWIGKRIAEAA